MTILVDIDNILQYYSILYTSEQYLTIPNKISSLLSGLRGLAVLKLFCYPDTQTEVQVIEELSLLKMSTNICGDKRINNYIRYSICII